MGFIQKHPRGGTMNATGKYWLDPGLNGSRQDAIPQALPPPQKHFSSSFLHPSPAPGISIGVDGATACLLTGTANTLLTTLSCNGQERIYRFSCLRRFCVLRDAGKRSAALTRARSKCFS